MSDNRQKSSGDGSGLGTWIFIIICLASFWPLGLFLLLRKLRSYAKGSQAYTHGAKDPYAVYEKNGTQKGRSKKKSGKRSDWFAPFILLLVSILLVAYGAQGIYKAARDIALNGAGRSGLWDLMVSSFYCVGGLLSFGVRGVLQRRSRRFKKFQTLVAGRSVVSILEIASAAGVSPKAARRTLQAMLDDGYFGENAYIDAGLDSLVMSAWAAEAARTAAKPKESKQEPEPKRPAESENAYAAIIRELRELNVTIIDESISKKIDRIEYITAQIFRAVEDDPSKQPQIRRFMSYYLPTTLKLLHAYATLERQGIQGENIIGAKQNIDRILDTLSDGFEQQLDMLFKSDVIDISSDISVLESMMKQDGLTSGGLQMPSQ